MDRDEQRAMQKKKDRESEKAEEKEREREQEREAVRSGTPHRHVWLIAIGTVLVLLIVFAWTLSP
jgi:hypothetical protein